VLAFGKVDPDHFFATHGPKLGRHLRNIHAVAPKVISFHNPFSKHFKYFFKTDFFFAAGVSNAPPLLLPMLLLPLAHPHPFPRFAWPATVM
jgi:hypothetical protein